jgi:glycosyltransferase involved in cell wall biosynthesis
MKVAQIAPFWYPSSLRTVSSPERMAGELSIALSERGHKVTLFCSGDSDIGAPNKYYYNDCSNWKCTRGSFSIQKQFNQLYEKLAAHVDRFDILHFHDCGLEMRNLVSRLSKPGRKIVVTVHHSQPWQMLDFQDREFQSIYSVFLSRSQRKLFKSVPGSTLIPGSVDLGSCYPRYKNGSFLVYAGRITRDRGVDTACRIAVEQGQKLMIIGDVSSYDQTPFYQQEIIPFLRHYPDLIVHTGVQDNDLVKQIIRKAKALIMPVRCDEPFYAAVAEAQACGTPVLAFNRGAMSEMIQDQKTGFLAKNYEDLQDKIARIDQIDRYMCRIHAEKQFNFKTMVNRYEQLYSYIGYTQSRVNSNSRSASVESPEVRTGTFGSTI